MMVLPRPLFFFALAALCFLAACASPAFHSESLDRSETLQKLPPKRVVENVPYIRQQTAHCGPATLAMVMKWAGSGVTAKEISKQVYTPGAKGSFQTDMIGASRRQGFFAVPLTGFDPLLQEIAAGHPVIIFENLGVSWMPIWHYAVVYGYDLPRKTFVLHSGKSANETVRMRWVEKDWMLGEYWGLVVLPPGELSASADELTQVKAAFALEQIGKSDEAQKSYRAILGRWPASLPAAVGAANIAYVKKDFGASVSFLKQATETHPQSAAAWHNLAIAQQSANQKEAAKKSALHAIELASPEEKITYVERLRDVIR